MWQCPCIAPIHESDRGRGTQVMGYEVGAGGIHPGKWIARLALPGLLISNNDSPAHIRASKIVGTFMQTTHQKFKLL